MARGHVGEQAVRLLIKRGRLERFEADDLTALADAQLARAARRLQLTATAALTMGDVDGAYVAAYDAYRIAAEALLAAQGLLDPSAAPITRADASWAIDKATAAVAGVRRLLRKAPPGRFG